MSHIISYLSLVAHARNIDLHATSLPVFVRPLLAWWVRGAKRQKIVVLPHRTNLGTSLTSLLSLMDRRLEASWAW